MKQVRPNIICFLTDRLHLGYLGAYGNSWIGTAAFDRLACESVLFDRAFATSLSLPALYRAFWYGHEPFAADLSAPDEKEPGFFGRLFAKGAAAPVSPLFTALSGTGYRTVLVTDDMETARLGKGLFEKVELFSPAKGIAETAEQSAVFRGLKDAADAASRMARGRAPFFLWIHLKGWGGIWDTPQQLRDEAREDDGDPPPYGGAIPPSFEMPPDADDDPLHAVLETYAAGVRLWDTSLEFFLGMLNREGLFERTALFVGGARGLSLGEHLHVGPGGAGSLYFEEIHVPLLYRPAGKPSEAVRSFALCGPDDLYRTLLRLAGGEPNERTLLDLASEETESIRSGLSVTQADASSPRQGVITDEWFFLRDTASVPPRRELYLVPDDRWNVNEVADRAGEEVLDELEGKIGCGGFA